MTELGLPYAARSRQEEGRFSEKQQAKKYGARLHPMSGAGSIKDDASNEDCIFEFKDAKVSHTLQLGTLKGLFQRATQAGKVPMYVVKFAEGYVAEMTIRRERNV